MYERESEPFRKVHRLVDLLETIIKTHTVVFVSNFLHKKALSDDIKSFIAGSLRTPSLGHWHEFSRVIADDLLFNFLTEQQYEHLIQTASSTDQKQQLSIIYEKQEPYYVIRKGTPRKKLMGFLKKLLTKQIEKKHLLFPNPYIVPSFLYTFFKWEKTVQKVIDIRNQYAHGATPNDKQCSKDIEQLEEILTSWLQEDWLHETKIDAHDSNGNSLYYDEANELKPNKVTPYHPYIVTMEGEYYSLFPLLYTQQNETLYNLIFFNDLKKIHSEKISYLNYPYAEHIHDTSIYHDFLSVIDYNNWKNFKNSIFNERIQELTSNFHGRKNELKSIYDYIQQHNNGFFYVTGIAGIGKSALLAAASMKLSKDKSLYCIPYFVGKGTRLADYSYFVQQLNAQIEEVFKTKIHDGPTLKEQVHLLQTRLAFASALLTKQQKKCIIIIDGIDEFQDIHLHNNLSELLFTEPLANIIFLYGARQSDASKAFYFSLPITKREQLELKGLNEAYLRSILYATINKYEIEREDPLIDCIMEKSEGNPLYIKLTCLMLEQKPWSKQTIEKMPRKIEEFYEDIINRLAQDTEDQPFVDALLMIACLKDFVSLEMLCHTMDIPFEVANQCMQRLSAYLVESDKLSGHFQLFHDSFRTYIMNKYINRCRELKLKIISFCKKWNRFMQYEGPLATYAFCYTHVHLYELQDAATLKAFIRDKNYSFAQANQVSIKYSLDMIWTYLLLDESASIEMALHALTQYEQTEKKIQDIINLFPSSPSVLAHIMDGLSVASRIQIYIQAIQIALASPQEASVLIAAFDEQIPRHTEMNLLDFYDFKQLSQFITALELRGINSEPLLARMILPKQQCCALMEQTTKWTWIDRKIFATMLKNLRYDGERYDPLCELIADLSLYGHKQTAKLTYTFMMASKPTVPMIKKFLRKLFDLFQDETLEGEIIRNILDEAFYWAKVLPNTFKSQNNDHYFFATISGGWCYEIVRPYYLNIVAKLAYKCQYYSLSRAASVRAFEEVKKVPDHFLRSLKYALRTELIKPPEHSLVDFLGKTIYMHSPVTQNASSAFLDHQEIQMHTLSAYRSKIKETLDDLSKLPALTTPLAEALLIQRDIVPTEKIDLEEVNIIIEEQSKKRIQMLLKNSRDPISDISNYGYQLFLQGNMELGLNIIQKSTEALKVFDYKWSYDDSRLFTRELYALEKRIRYLYKIVQYFIQSDELERAKALAGKISKTHYKAAALYLVARAYIKKRDFKMAHTMINTLLGYSFKRSGSTLRFALAAQLHAEIVLAYAEEGDLEKSLQYAIETKQPQEVLAKIQLEMLKIGETIITPYIENTVLRQGILYAFGQYIAEQYAYGEMIEQVRNFSREPEFRFLLFGVWNKMEPVYHQTLLQALEPMLAYHVDQRKFYTAIVTQPSSIEEDLLKKIVKSVLGDKSLLQYILAIIGSSEKGEMETIEELIRSLQKSPIPRFEQFEEWIESIEDEDDQEYLRLLRRQVEKRKLSHEEFEEIAVRYERSGC